MEYLLSMHNIEKYYGPVRALENACLEVKPGEIHALIGANGAGKSTLMKILCGELEYESGEILFDGKETVPYRDQDSAARGIFLIHQEVCVVPDLTVAQYLFLGREPHNGLIIDDRKMSDDAVRLLQSMEAEIPPETPMGQLSVAAQQMVELSKAVSFDMKLLVLDEPTTALGDKETKQLFKVMKNLQQQGISIIYISHRLEEILEITDRVTVMRDGKYIETRDTKDTTREDLVMLLTGREAKVTRKTASAVAADAETVLEVRGLSADPLPAEVSFSLKKGEILGLAGLVGAGRTETAKAICGILPKTAGEIFMNGKEVQIRSPKEAAEAGICYLSEDRNAEGVIGSRSIIANTVLSSLDRYRKGLRLDDAKMESDAVDINLRLKTKYSDPHGPVTSLSGGNVQKVVIAKWLVRDTQIFIFDEPTKGIDVGAKDEIYLIIADIVKNGHSVIIISSDTEELLYNCDRLLVMYEGRITGELKIEDADAGKLMHYAMGGDE